MAYLVEQRRREIGIRMALGARRTEVMTQVLGQSAALIAMGVGVGLTGAMGLTRYLEGLLFGLTPLDAATFAAASLLFATVALAASYVPARRATKVDPIGGVAGGMTSVSGPGSYPVQPRSPFVVAGEQVEVPMRRFVLRLLNVFRRRSRRAESRTRDGCASRAARGRVSSSRHDSRTRAPRRAT